MSVVGEGVDKQRTQRFTHSQLINEVRKEIQRIKNEVLYYYYPVHVDH